MHKLNNFKTFSIYLFMTKSHLRLTGAFLIPYLIMLIFEGVPLLYVELTVGQMLRKGSMGSWIKISPYMQGTAAFHHIPASYWHETFNLSKKWVGGASFWVRIEAHWEVAVSLSTTKKDLRMSSNSVLILPQQRLSFRLHQFMAKLVVKKRY